jgi:acetyl esterase/lipase
MIMRSEELRFGPGERQVVDVRLPAKTRRIGLFYIHGGGWYAGRRQDFHGHLDHFAERGFAAAATGYRIDEHTGYRDKINDVTAGLRAFRDLLADRAPGVDRIVVLGSSAGAHLATMVALGSVGSDDERSPIAGCVSVNGPGTLVPWPEQDAGIRTKIEWLQADGTSLDELSPERQVPDGCPPFLFLLAEYEHLFPHDQVRQLAALIEQRGGWTETAVVPETKHGFVYALGGPAQDRSLELIAAFLDRLGSD